VYDPLAGRFLTADPVMQAPFWSQGLNRYSYVFNNPVNNTDPSGFDARGGDVAAGIMGWGGAVTALAAGGFNGLAIGAVNPVTSAFMPSIGDGSAASTLTGSAPLSAPKGGLGGRNSPPGALGQLQPPGPASKQEWLRSRGFADDRLAMGPACLINPIACAQMAADAVATLMETSVATVEATTVAVAEATAEGAAKGAATALFYLQLLQMGDDINHGAVQIRAPGVPTADDGFTPPKNWNGELVRNPNGPGVGYPDRKGRVWVPTGTGPTAHGGPHWDVQTPGGGYENVYPGGKVRK